MANRNPLRSILAAFGDIRKMAGIAGGPSSLWRYSVDRIGMVYVHGLRTKPSNRLRKIQLRGGVSISYRFNSGDMQSLKEVWMLEVYKLPFEAQPGVVVDLGANIGLSSVYFAKHYGYERLVLIEPSPENARMARLNLENNGVKGEVVEAAVGPEDGEGHFQDEGWSNIGRLAPEGRLVRLLSMDTILNQYARGQAVGLMKMDIEGGEESLLRGDLEWTKKIPAIIAELHPNVIDYPATIGILQRAGYRHIDTGSVHTNSCEAFVK